MSRLAASLLGIAGVVHAVLGVAALTGAERLEANVREIAGSPVGGDLYFSLGTWGFIAAVIAALELYAAWRLAFPGKRPAPSPQSAHRGPFTPPAMARGRLIALIAGFLGTGMAFFSLPLFRWPVVATIPLLLAATYLLAYRVADGKPAAGGP